MGKDRTTERYGQTWTWRQDYTGHWVSTAGLLVSIFPPSGDANEWLVVNGYGKSHRFTGEDAEERAFCVAEGFTRQSSIGDLDDSANKS